MVLELELEESSVLAEDSLLELGLMDVAFNKELEPSEPVAAA